MNYATMNGFMRKFAIFSIIGITALMPLASVLATDTPVTFVRRSEAAMILMKNAGVAVDIDAKSYGDYPDVLDGEWYVPYILKGLELGLFSVEESTGLVHPHRSVSRADFLMMITKVFDLTRSIPYSYTDVSEDDWFSAYAGLSWRYKLFDIKNNPNLLQPHMRITHEEVAQALYTLLTKEPSLQPEPGMLPVKSEHTYQKDTDPTLLKTIHTQIQGTSQKIVEAYTDTITPQNVKSAMLNLFRSRASLAEQTRNELIAAVNEVRAQYNLASMRSSYYLEQSAQRHAKDMADRGYFSHFTPEGLSYVDRIKAAGYLHTNPLACSCSQQFDLDAVTIEQGPDFIITGNEQCSCDPIFSLGENLAKGQLSVKQVMADWMESPNHRKNILRPEFEEIGIGLFGDVWVQNFGRLKFQ